MRRLTRKKLKQDEFVSGVDKIIRWVTEHWKPVTAVVVSVTAILLIVWGVTSWLGSREDAASWALAKAMKTYQTQQKNGGTVTPDVRAAFEKVIEKYGSTKEADAARIYLARIDFEAGKIDQAKAALEKIAARHKGDALGAVATLDLVHMRVASGQASEVIEQLLAMATGQDDTLPRDVALYELAAAYEAEKDNAQAREYYQKLIDEFPKSPYVRSARQKLVELG